MRKRITGDLLRRVFDGSAKGLIMGALEAQPASPEDLADIRQMIDSLDKKEDKKKRGTK
jgi:predicted transcriptional regulator